MANILPPYIADLVLGFSRRSTEQLESLVALHPSHQAYLPLQNALNSVPEESINVKFIAPILASLPTETRDTFGTFVIALLKYIRLPDGQDFESAHAKFQELVSAYVEANRVFASVQDGIHTCACLNPIILALARRLLDLTEHAASLTPHVLKHPQSPRSMRDTTRQTLERSMQIATAHYPPDQWASANSHGPMVGDIIWEMGNILWRIFARRQLYSTAAELDRTFAKLRPREDDRIRARADHIRYTDICQTYYWRGRLGVKLLNFRGAKEWLDLAWSWCPEDSWQQRRAILIRLIPVNLLLGHLPDPALLRAYSLTHFSPLIHHFRTGNVAAWRRELDDKREWYRGRSIWLLLHERGEILVWRNLLRRSLRTHYQANPSAPLNRCPTSVLLQTVRKAFEGTGEVEDGALELEDIIVVIASCIDHGLILGYLSYSQNQLVMKPRADGMGGFPAISTVTPRKIDANQ